MKRIFLLSLILWGVSLFALAESKNIIRLRGTIAPMGVRRLTQVEYNEPLGLLAEEPLDHLMINGKPERDDGRFQTLVEAEDKTQVITIIPLIP